MNSSPTIAGPTITRRSLLGGLLAASGVILAGCQSSAPVNLSAPTVTSLTSDTPFYIAHRGGGLDWPEMTEYAYDQAARIPGLQAMEISVCLSSDGVLVASHDPTTERVTGTDYTIADQTWATLSTLKVSAEATRNPSQPAQPLTRFDTVAQRYIDRFVLFVEPKVPAAEEPLLRMLGELNSPRRVVWKQPSNARRFADAKEAGYATWGYVLNTPSFLGDALKRAAADPAIDMLGIPVRAGADVTGPIQHAANDHQKKTIAWAIETEADRQLALGFGASGLMTSDIAGLMPPPSATPSS